jgi:hypothetical protein
VLVVVVEVVAMKRKGMMMMASLITTLPELQTRRSTGKDAAGVAKQALAALER